MLCSVLTVTLHAQEPMPLVKSESFSDTQTINNLLQQAEKLKATEPEDAIRTLELAKHKSLQIAYKEGLVNSLIKIGNVQREASKFKEALSSYLGALGYCDSTDVTQKYFTSAYTNIGSIYSKLGNLDAAVKFYSKAIDAADKFGSVTPVELVYANLSIVFAKLHQTDKAFYYSDKAEQHYRANKDFHRLAYVLNNKATLYLENSDFDNAEQTLMQVLKISKAKELGEGEFIALNNLGEIYLKRKLPEKAIVFFKRASEYRGALNPYLKLGNSLSLGNAYIAQQKYTQAIPMLKAALSMANELNIQDALMSAEYALAEAYEGNNQTQDALIHFKQYLLLKDSIANNEVKTNINQIEAKYRTAEKDKTLLSKQLLITKQQKKIQQKNLQLFGLGAGIVLSVLISFALFLYYRNRQKLAASKRRIEQLEATMNGEEQERTRIARELHDGIGGMLTSVKLNLVAVQKQFEHVEGGVQKLSMIADMIQDTSAELRKSAHNLMPDVLLQYSLQDALARYAASINNAEKIEITFHYLVADVQIPKSVELMLYRITQELIQNVIKHAQATVVAVQISLQDNELNLTVEDNGHGFDVNEYKNSGFGLQNLIYRIESLQGKVQLFSEQKNGTTVHIIFNYSKLLKIYKL